MKVFNLSDRDLVYKGKTISPNGGFLELPDLMYIPPRDLKNKYLAFRNLPKGWKLNAPATELPEVTADKVPVVDPAVLAPRIPGSVVEEVATSKDRGVEEAKTHSI